MAWVKSRISSAKLVVADLSTANPNVYLEVGYAWAKGIPTVLLVRDTNDLKFDVKAQRCIVYTSIKQLEELLSKELKVLI
jgi:nucleoside 2-deoxyribosyltransferase